MKKIGIIVGSIGNFTNSGVIAKNIAFLFPSEFKIDFIEYI